MENEMGTTIYVVRREICQEGSPHPHARIPPAQIPWGPLWHLCTTGVSSTDLQINEVEDGSQNVEFLGEARRRMPFEFGVPFSVMK